MANKLRIILLSVFILLCLLLGSGSAHIQQAYQPANSAIPIEYDAILKKGIHDIAINQNADNQPTDIVVQLEQWYHQHPSIEYASLVGSSITVKFIDGSYTVVLAPGL